MVNKDGDTTTSPDSFPFSEKKIKFIILYFIILFICKPSLKIEEFAENYTYHSI